MCWLHLVQPLLDHSATERIELLHTALRDQMSLKMSLLPRLLPLYYRLHVSLYNHTAIA